MHIRNKQKRYIVIHYNSQKVKDEIKTESASPQKGRKKKEGETQEVWKWYVYNFDIHLVF